jgi:hypothetical protein
MNLVSVMFPQTMDQVEDPQLGGGIISVASEEWIVLLEVCIVVKEVIWKDAI